MTSQSVLLPLIENTEILESIYVLFFSAEVNLYKLRMYILAYLIDCNLNIVIPAIWVENFDSELCFNHGLNRNKVYKIFFSHLYKTADFDAPLRTVFASAEDATYRARLCTMKCKQLVCSN